MSKQVNHSANGADLYHPVEHKILSEFLGVEPLVPVGDIDLWTQPGEGEEFFALQEAEYAGEQMAIQNAVARLALEGIQHRLPQWGVCDDDGRIEQARDYHPKKKRTLSLLPRFLFGINWATSGPGYEWPEQYHYAYLPGYHRWVVTASQDSPEVHGYTDEAIGHFSGDEKDIIGACGQVVRDWWAEAYSKATQQPWEYYESWNASPVDEEMAKEWAWQVWGDGSVECPPRWFEEMATERRSDDEDEDDWDDYEEIAPGAVERPSFGLVE